MQKTVGFVLFENFFQKRDIGSSRIRGHWVIEKMEEAELFCQGKEYKVIIFQKAYWKEMARAFKGKKLLDICDPDWLDGAEVVAFAKEMDYITTSTEKLAEDLRKMVDCPVQCVPDRINLESLPPRKHHQGTAKKIAWFGYAHNSDVLEPALDKIKELGLELTVISEGIYRTSECPTVNVKYDSKTVDEELLKCDFVLLPGKKGGRFPYKSENKTEQAWALGLPVAKTPEDMDRFMDGMEREIESLKNWEYIQTNCDVRKSVDEYRKIIDSIQKV